MKIAIIGRSEILYDTARALLKGGHEITCIVTAKEAPEYKRTSVDFKSLADELNVPFGKGANILHHQNILRASDSDVAISVNYSGIIPQEIIDIFPIGILNAHGGDLPKYRGNACQAWALINGEPLVGLCIHKMIGGELDSGDIICRDYYPADINTKIHEIWFWMQKRIPEMFLDASEKLSNEPSYYLEVQSKNPKDALRCYPRTPEDGRIDWSDSAKTILRLINASGPPYEGAFSMLESQKIVLLDAYLEQDDEVYCAVPGQVTGICHKTSSFTVATGDGKLTITKALVNGEDLSTEYHCPNIRTRLI